ncbi:response regulator [Bacillus thuringiensis]|uniref:response regulator n=1 Tax=Bacillus thuringiensis TaxID=1428 RepID=UPI0021B39543|nr:response regulator [Bacillus thuringiensis]
MEKVLRVLVIDDAHFVRDLIKRAMVKKPDDEFTYEVIKESETGKEGIIDYFKLKPDFIVLDLSLPDMDGFDAMKQILSKEPNAKIIAMSDDYSDSMKEKALANGATHYVPKPFQNAFLWKGVDTIVKQLREEGFQFPYESSEKGLNSEIVWEEVKEEVKRNVAKKENVVVITSSDEDEEDELFADISPSKKMEHKSVVVLEDDEFLLKKGEHTILHTPEVVENKETVEIVVPDVLTKGDTDLTGDNNIITFHEREKNNDESKLKKDEHIIKHYKNISSDNNEINTYDMENIKKSDAIKVDLEDKKLNPSEGGQTLVEPIVELKSDEGSYNEPTKDNDSSSKPFSIRPPRDSALKKMYEEQYQNYPSYYGAEDVERKTEETGKNKQGLFSSIKKIFKKL